MSYEIYRIDARCKCPCGKGEIITGDSMNDWNQIRYDDKEIWCPECSKKYKFTEGGLISIDYPDYKGDPEIEKQISVLEDKKNYLDKNELKLRYKEYMTESEYKEYCDNPTSDISQNAIEEIYKAKRYISKYKRDILLSVQEELQKARNTSDLSETAYKMAKDHEKRFGTRKVSNVLKTINRAVRIYNAAIDFYKKDRKLQAELDKQIAELNKIYYADYDEYLEEKKKHIIPYTLIPVNKENTDD